MCTVLGPCVEQIITQHKGSDMERGNTHFSSINVQIFAKILSRVHFIFSGQHLSNRAMT